MPRGGRRAGPGAPGNNLNASLNVTLYLIVTKCNFVAYFCSELGADEDLKLQNVEFDVLKNKRHLYVVSF